MGLESRYTSRLGIGSMKMYKLRRIISVMTEHSWAFEQPYCEECHNNLFTYCAHCDGEIYRNNAYFNDDGEPYCEDCYEVKMKQIMTVRIIRKYMKKTEKILFICQDSGWRESLKQRNT